ncbi:MAG: UDP-3-O-acyl-N-acetylglucosamine deacetylase [Bdellovibrionota bacterium]
MIGKYQGTIKSKVAFAGVGLHSGKIVNLEVRPACANTGIIFLRTDTPSGRPIVAHPYNVTSTELCTSIGDGDDRIGTIEHLMAAFYGLGIDNAFVLVDAGELPILDGSAAPFVDKLKEVGTEVQPCLRKVLVIKKPIEVQNGDQFIRIDPWQSLAFECTIDFENSSAIGKQSAIGI